MPLADLAYSFGVNHPGALRLHNYPNFLRHIERDGTSIDLAAVDILPHPVIRQQLSAISEWPTIPQLFINGELIGGSDIVLEMYESGELADALGVEQPDGDAPAPEAAPAGQAPMGIENRLG